MMGDTGLDSKVFFVSSCKFMTEGRAFGVCLLPIWSGLFSFLTLFYFMIFEIVPLNDLLGLMGD